MAKQRRHRRRVKPPKGKLVVWDAARFLGVTTAAVYISIKKGRLKASYVKTRTGGKQLVLDYQHLKDYKRAYREALKPKPKRPLTDDEFLARMIENDPD